MARLFIAGAGGFGREMYWWLQQNPEWGQRFTFAGFLDDNPNALASFKYGPGVVEGIATFAPQPGDEVVCALGDPRKRLRVGRELRARGAMLPIIRHPLAILGGDCRIGPGTILCPGSVVSTNVTLGELVLVNICATVGHDARLGDGVTLSPHADVTGFAELAEGAFLGSHASVLPRAKVGAYSLVGAGSVVLRSVKPGATVVGVPAKQILP
jgi:sugar O-acyltransferase (sialic acid O-acetyltransferase NeuD family)